MRPLPRQPDGKKEARDDEAMVHDEEFCVALEYGLPPNRPIGHDAEDYISIEEVLLFLRRNLKGSD